MITKYKEASMSVYAGSYMDSLFVSYYLHHEGIESHLENVIKGSEKIVSPGVFPSTKVVVSKINHSKATRLMQKFHKRRSN
ncbi:MAG: hypothetical protein ABIJ97_04295 [Bacteroidota bacterium]